jgi:hypothetical protein
MGEHGGHRREGAVAIMYQISWRLVVREGVSELLGGPRRRGVVGEIPLRNPVCADVEDER